MNLTFKENSEALTLGVELEFQVLDQATHQLTPRASEIIEKFENDKLNHEMFQSTLEVITGVCRSVHDVDRDLKTSIDQVRTVLPELGLKLAATGTHPMADYRERLITDTKRYHELIDRNQWLIRRMAVYGMHIHFGVKSGDDCVRFGNFFLHFAPHLIALSASSPFWQKMDTGLVSCRPTMYESLPTAGMPYLVKNWKEFENLIKFLKRSDAIQSLKDLWWDIRPSPAWGTIELRICDGPATHQEMLGIVAFTHALAHWFTDHHDEWEKSHTPMKRWIFRENKWRAIRYGLDASIIIDRVGRTNSLKNDIENWMKRLEPYIQKLNYQQYLEIIPQLLEKGNSAQRQRSVMDRTQDGMEVVRFNMKEFEKGAPIWN